jgi:PAS domain S-box-containing protein
MDNHLWVNEFAGAITVCDSAGIILEMNYRAEKMFLEQGRRDLVGSNLIDCHPEHARTKLQEIMKQRQANVYTIEKNGQKKILYQAPWYTEGQYCGYVEIVLDLPGSMPHFIRG